MDATCPHCSSTNTYPEASRTRGVVCSACGKPFAPVSYSTEAKPPPAPLGTASLDPHDARARLVNYVLTYPTQADHDRDLMLIAIFDRIIGPRP